MWGPLCNPQDPHTTWWQTRQDTPNRACVEQILTQDGASMDWTCSSMSHGCWSRLGSGWGHVVSQQNLGVRMLFIWICLFFFFFCVFWLIVYNSQRLTICHHTSSLCSRFWPRWGIFLIFKNLHQFSCCCNQILTLRSTDTSKKKNVTYFGTEGTTFKDWRVSEFLKLFSCLLTAQSA